MGSSAGWCDTSGPAQFLMTIITQYCPSYRFCAVCGDDLHSVLYFLPTCAVCDDDLHSVLYFLPTCAVCDDDLH